MPRKVSTAIIGAGIGGVAAAQALLARGQDDFVILERAPRPGGVWQANEYPGVACDVPSVAYSFSFAPNPEWTRRFSPGAEIQAYVARVVDELGFADRLRPGADVRRARFDEDGGRWHLELADGEVIDAEVVISACGQLTRPAIPALPGLDAFEGTWFHSARWPRGERLEGKRVAVVGTGASAIQFAPAIAPDVEHMTIFQRSGPWILPKLDTRYGPLTRWLYRRFPRLQRLARAFWLGAFESLAPNFTQPSSLRARLLQATLRPLAALVRFVQLRGDRALIAKATPDYPMGCKRVLLSTHWYPNLRRPNVDLCTSPIREVAPDGIVTEDGVHHAVDAIAFGTGFTATDFLAPMEVIGRGGLSIHDFWKEGAEAFLGMSVPGFPNFFIFYGPNTNHGTGSVFEIVEAQSRYAAQAIDALARGDAERLEVLRPAHERFVEEMEERLAGTIWAQCSSWYVNEAGRITNQWPGTYEEYRQRTARFDIGDFQVDGAEAPDEPLVPREQSAAVGAP